VLSTLTPTKPDPAVVAAVTEAAIAAETILGHHHLSLAGIVGLDEDTTASALRTIAREWPGDIPRAARWLVAGTTSRSASAVARFTIGPVAHALGAGATRPEPGTIRRWAGWYRTLAQQPIAQRIAA
jgi:hypothetical protein